jgi:hypothetical protein
MIISSRRRVARNAALCPLDPIDTPPECGPDLIAHPVSQMACGHLEATQVFHRPQVRNPRGKLYGRIESSRRVCNLGREIRFDSGKE